MAANEDKKPVPAAVREESSKVLATQPREHLPVALVRWERPLQIPGKQADDMVKTESTPNGRSWTVEYLPAMRHFKISYVRERSAPPMVGYVHESRALSWEPA